MTRDPFAYAHEVRLRRNPHKEFEAFQRKDLEATVKQVVGALHARPAVPFGQILKSTRSQ